MTVSSTTTKNSYSGNGSTSAFAYAFKIFDDDDVTVIIRTDSTGTETVKTKTTHYTVSGVGNTSGGNITFTSGNIPASGETVLLLRSMPLTQATDYTPNDPFPAATHEDALDKLTFISQDVQEEVDRSIKLSRANTMTSTEFTVPAATRANKIFAFDSSGELAVTQEIGTFKGDWAASTAYAVRDLVKDTSTNNIFIVNEAHTSSGSQPLTTNANSAKYDLIVDAASATTSASAAASSATAAASSASTASTQASNASSSASTASTQASNASTSASTASTQASNASSSATAAASSATAAANSATAAANSEASFTTGISSGNVLAAGSGIADDDFIRVNGTSMEGRSASEVLSDIGAAPAAGSSNIVTTGALNSGSITSGFGTIDTGSSAITTTGVITGGTLEATADTSAGDNAAIGFTSAEGLILTGQGSTSDITVKNDADATVFTVPTGTDDILFPDNAKILMGAGSDLQIYHDGSDSYIAENSSGATGDLKILGNNIKLRNSGDSIDYIATNASSGAITLSHDGSSKFATTSTGVSITGGFTATDGCTITTADNSAQLTLVSTDADGSRGPELLLERLSSSPADNDALGFITWKFKNDAGTSHDYCGIEVLATDVSDGSEDATWQLFTQVAGTSRSRFSATPTETVLNEDSQDLDFRVESNGNANMLFVDAGNDCIGISNNIPGSFNTGGNNLVVGSGSGSEGITIYGGNESNIFFADGTASADNLRGRIEYSHLSEAMKLYVNNSEAIRVDTNRHVLLGQSSSDSPGAGDTVTGSAIRSTGIAFFSADGSGPLRLNRKSDDGVLINFSRDGVAQGSIGVSSGTVSLTGAHLSRWSQATDGQRISGLLRGTVMTNLDQMAVWHHEAKAATYYEEGDELPEGVSVGDEKTPAADAYDEDNEQLNCMTVSSVEGDANVSGVFQSWDDDDDVYLNDMIIAMTGDFVIRIAQDTTVARGDLLISAGDGTAKPQGDDIVRSKTIAKVTSTNKSHTYDDGSYLVPCVLMAC